MSSNTITLSEGDYLQAAIAWYAFTDYPSTEVDITNYDLILFDENENILCQSTLDNNSELIKYTATSDGTYLLAVYQNGERHSDNTEDRIGIAYNITQ